MKHHNDGHYFVPGSRQTGRYEPRGFMVGSYAKPTLTEQGIDVDEFIRQNRHLIERLRRARPRERRPHHSKDPETGRYRTTNQTIEQEEPIMTVTVQEKKQEAKPEEPRTIIANALVGIFDAVSALQRTAFQANDKVVYGFATKLLTGELMDIKANYSKDTAK